MTVHLARIALLTALAASYAPMAYAGTFDFGPYAPTNASVPLSITNAGLTASFSSPSGAGAFIAEDGSPFSTLGAAVLANDNLAPEELDIRFSAPVKSIAFAFATDDLGLPSTLTLVALNGAATVGTMAVTGAVAASGLPEGVLAFGGVPFTAVTITDPDTAAFAIGAVTASTVPAPAAWLSFAATLAGLVARRRPG